MTFSIQADTPEEMRNAIVKWLNMNASNHRIVAAKIAGIHKKEVETATANAYQAAADFLANCKIEKTFKCRAPKADCLKPCTTCLAMEETGPE